MSRIDPPASHPPISPPPMHVQAAVPQRSNNGRGVAVVVVLVLRGLCLLLSFLSFIVLVTVKDFNKVDIYKYVLAAGLLSFIYNALQTSKLIYELVSRKQLIPNRKISTLVDVIGDQVVIFMLATASLAGLAILVVANDVKQLVDAFFSDLGPFQHLFDKAIREYTQVFDKVAAAGSMLFLAFAALVFPNLYSVYSFSLALAAS